MSTEIVYIVAVGGNLILALVVILNGIKKRADVSLAILSIAFAAWLGTIYASETFSQDVLLWNKLVFVPPLIIPLALFLFIRILIEQEEKYKHILVAYYMTAAVLLIMLFTTSWLVAGATQRIDSRGVVVGYDIIRGPVYYLFLFYLVSFLTFSSAISIIAYHKSRGLLKNQLKYIISGTILGIIWGLFFNVLMVNLTGTSEYARYGALSGVIMVVFYSLAIIRHRLLDIRYVIFRLLAYTISLGIITLLFVLLVFNLTDIIFAQQSVPFSLQIYYVITAVVVALLFGPIKRFVDRGSNRLFFQQNYSAHDAIEKIGNFSTRSVDVYNIQQHSLRVLQETIRPEYAGFIMFDPHGKLKLAGNIGNYPEKSLELEGFLAQLSKIHHKITIGGEVKGNNGHIKEYFELSRIGIISRLSTDNKSIGYLILGDKKNGNAYNRHDTQFLTLAANDLALAFQNAQRYEEIQAFNETLQEKVNKATSALKRTNAKLVALDDIKDEFISMTSHQLRTPLTSIKGYISMILEGDMGKINPTQRQALEEAFSSSQRMVFLISDFLNVSRIRTGKFTIERSETDLGQIVTEEIAQLQDVAGLRDQTINFKASKDFPKIFLDEPKTRQVMMNLIDNAIFYTPKSGRIDISLTSTDKEVIFEVTDTGIGVPKNVQHRLFTKFFRAENARKARPDGTGLGLFMAQKIIDLQGGKIIFNSVENKGSTFGFRFPLKIIRGS